MHTTISKRSYSDLRKNTVSAAATATRALEFTSRLHESLFRVKIYRSRRELGTGDVLRKQTY
jgi:hypothetical protein